MAESTIRALRGGARALLYYPRRVGWIDLLLFGLFLGLGYGIISLAQRWTGVLQTTAEIDLSLSALPKYALFSLARGLLAYVLSLIFTLVYGYWAAKDRVAGRVLIPLLDILQSVPVLGFMPGLVLALIALFPSSNIGLELAAVLMIFTGQVWNMTFSFYHSLCSIPSDQEEVAALYRFNRRQRLWWVELPYATMGLVWNSMMSMAGGWFFLMISETFVLGQHDFRLPGIGSYMSLAVARGDAYAMILAIVTMIIMIVALDQLLWRPVVAWAQKFRIEEASQEIGVKSWFLDWLHHSHILPWFGRRLRAFRWPSKANWRIRAREATSVWTSSSARMFSMTVMLALGVCGLVGAFKIWKLVNHVSGDEWMTICFSAALTLVRVLAAVAIGTLWALPAGLLIGLSPRLSRVLQPVVQVFASFPAPMLFPAAVAVMSALHVQLGWGSIVLLLLGTQWYILFNVVAGAMAIPSDLRETARSYRLTRWQRLVHLYIPAIFPHLVTGWVTAAGGGWNASIVAEFVAFKGAVIETTGLGALISRAAVSADFPVLAAAISVMAILVVSFNRIVWRRLYNAAQGRFTIGR